MDSTLRQLVQRNSIFNHDSLLVSDIFEECQENNSDTVHLMTNIGFDVHPSKSVLMPTQNIKFLGDDIYSVEMTVALPQEKVSLIVQECLRLSKKYTELIRTIARVL